MCPVIRRLFFTVSVMFTFLCKGLWWDTAEKGLSCCLLLQQVEGGGWYQWCPRTNIWWSPAPAMGPESSAPLQPPLAESLSTPLLKWELVPQWLPACTCVQRPPNCVGSQSPLQPRGPTPLVLSTCSSPPLWRVISCSPMSLWMSFRLDKPANFSAFLWTEISLLEWGLIPSLGKGIPLPSLFFFEYSPSALGYYIEFPYILPLIMVYSVY